MLDDAYKSVGDDPEEGLSTAAVTKFISNVYHTVEKEAEPAVTSLVCEYLLSPRLTIRSNDQGVGT